MRKANVVLVSLILLVVASFDLHAYSWNSHGIQYGRLTEHERFEDTRYETSIDSLGFYSSAFHFNWDAELGYFVHSAMLFPWEATVMTDSTFFGVTFEQADFAAQWSLMTGPAMRYPFSYGSTSYFGLGPEISLMVITIDGESYWDFDWGVGFSMGYLYDFSSNSFMDAGVVLDYRFASYARGPGDGGWTKAEEYGGYSFSSYIGFSIGGYR